MTTDIEAKKRELRRALRSRWKAVTDRERAELSAMAVELMRNRPEWNQARKVLLFAPLPDELDIRPLIADALNSNRLVALPRFDREKGVYEAAVVADSKTDLITGFKGIMEPGPKCPAVSLAEFDLVLVPGLGFDATGARLGRGKGYYDRILVDVRGKRCGVAMDWQVVESIPVSGHDMKVDFILTPTRWIDCRGPAVG